MSRKKYQSLRFISHGTRKSETKELKKAYLIACEGECTEPYYIRGLVKHQKTSQKIAAGTRVMIVPHEHSDPFGVLQDLLNVPNREIYDELWIVIDRDEVEGIGKGFGGHSQKKFQDCMKESEKNNVKVACSNPCFELWIVLHFEYRDTACSRIDIQKKAVQKVNTLLPINLKLKKIDDLKSLKNIYDLLEDKLDTARRNAEKLKENEVQCQNPYSGMFRLLNSLLQ